MLTRDREIGRSLRRADPDDLALLDLTLRRKVKDEVVAAVLRLQPADVAARRGAALERLAADLGMEEPAERARLSGMLSDLPHDQWPAPPDGQVAPPPRRTRERRGPWAAVVVVVVGALLGALIGLLLFGGDSDSGDDGGSTAKAPRAQSVALEPVSAAFPASGTARIEGTGPDSRLVLSLRDLPPREEAYAVWLYDSLGDSLLVDQAVGSSIDVNTRLPADPARYRYIDISREPLDGNRNHSGESVMRVPVDSLLSAR
jgi:hypothetical protein